MKIAVCDDDKTMLDSLCSEIDVEFAAYKLDFNIDRFSSGTAFIDKNESSGYDVVFLDIDMPEISGFDIAEQIDKSTFIVFVTSHDELVYSSFKFRPFRFIRKNYIKDELPEAVSALIKVLTEREETKRFEINTSSGTVYADLNEIEYVEIYGHWLRVCVHNAESIECYGSLSDFEKRLEKYSFIRTHKSYLVNCRYIYAIEKNSVILDDKSEIPLSRYKVEKVKEAVKDYLRRNV